MTEPAPAATAPAPAPPRMHLYRSTACFHGLHDSCRLTCKFCPETCLCYCHRPEPE